MKILTKIIDWLIILKLRILLKFTNRNKKFLYD